MPDIKEYDLPDVRSYDLRLLPNYERALRLEQAAT